MLFFGHIAIAVAVADTTHTDVASAVAGNLYPDIIDKSLRMAGLSPRGRWAAHGLPLLVSSLVAARALTPDPVWRGFAAGYLAHLAGDHYDGGRLPWLAPFQQPPPRRRTSKLRWMISTSLPELAGLAYLGWRAWRARPQA